MNKRAKLFKKIAKMYLKRASILDYDKNNKKLKECKSGVYVLVGKRNSPLYVGQVGNGECTSLYMRLFQHGSGGHQEKKWINDTQKIRFYSLNSPNSRCLSVLERIMIIELKPLHNDLDFSDKEAQELLDLLK